MAGYATGCVWTHGAATGGNDKYEREEEGVFGPVS